MGNRLRTIVVSVVLVVWAANFFASMFIPGYRPDPEVANTLNSAFMAVVGILSMSFAEREKKDDSNGRDADEESQSS